MNRPLAALLLPALLLSVSARAATVTLTAGQTGALGPAAVTLLRVEDSRCPTDVMCIRAGELRLSLLVTQGGRSRFLKLEWPAPSNHAQADKIRVLDALGRRASERWSVPVTLTDAPL